MLITLFLTLFQLFRSPAVQTLAARIAADYLSKELKTVIRIQGFNLSVFHGLVIEKILVLDLHRDTLFAAKELSVRPGHINISQRKLRISKVLIDHGNVQLITYKGDSSLNLQFILDHFASAKKSEPDTTSTKPIEISVSSIELVKTHFMLQDQNAEKTPVGMDYTNLNVRDINLELTDISFDRISIYAKIKHLDAVERCGLRLRSMTGSFQLGSRFLKAKKLKIVTDHSSVSMNLDFLYKDWNAYNYFVDSVMIRTKIESSFLDIEDIGYFAPDLLMMKDKIGIAGTIRGTVSNFKARDLLLSYGKNTLFAGNINMLGLPDLEETFVDMYIKKFSTSYNDLADFLLPGKTGHISLPDVLKNAGLISLKGKFTGFYNDFSANAAISSNLGTINTDLSLVRQPGKPKQIGYKGRLDVQSLNLGRLTGNTDMFGMISCKGNINGRGLTLNDADLNMNLKIDSVDLNRYRYSDIDVAGMLVGKKFEGKVKIDDPNVGLDFLGLIDMQDSIPEFNFEAAIQHAHLYNLNWLKRDSVTDLSTSLKVSVKANSIDNMNGVVKLENTTYTEGKKVITMDQFSLVTKNDSVKGKSYHLNSDFVDADITGNFSFSSLIPSMTTFIQNYLASFNLKDSLISNHEQLLDQEISYEFRFKNSDEVLAIFLPFLKISPNSTLYGNYDERKGSLVVKGEAPKVFVNNFEIDNWYLDAETRKDNLSVTSGAQRVYLIKGSKTDSLEIRLDSLHLLSNMRHDSIMYNIAWTNKQSIPSLITGFANFIKSPRIELKLTDFNVYIDNKYWNVDLKNQVFIDTTAFKISNLGFTSGEQFLRLDGSVTEFNRDTLSVEFNKVDISRLDWLLKDAQLDIDGVLNGKARIVNPAHDLSIQSDLRINKFKFNKELLGDATFKVGYNGETSRFDILSSIIYTGNIGTNIPFTLKGSLCLDKNNPVFDFDLTLKNLNLKMFGPFVKDFMSGVSGFASGQVKITGNPTKPLILGQLQFMRTEFKINYLNVPYSFADVVKIDTNAFLFKNITMFDSLGNKSVLNGKITHRNFSDLALDLHVDMEDFSAYNNTRAQNSLFYGKARATGTASITGPVNNINISVKATNGGKTAIAIPIDLTRSVGQADYIIFVEPDNDSLKLLKPKQPLNTGGMSLDLALRINDNAEVEVFFPEQLGNLKASGSGNLLMTMTPTTPFTLSCTYKLTKGFFLFQLKNYLRLPMSLLEGSSIAWSGDPADANVAISAVYKTKVPLKGITIDPNLESTRIPVDCIIRLKGKLMNPEISFGLELPNVDESIKNQVYTAIDTNNAVVMADQMIYLLVLNQFKPVVSNTGTVDMSGTAISLVTNQLNSMISQMTPNFSVNMNYKPGTSTTSQEFDVGISTQLFDDRLLIDGTFGMNTNSAYAQSTSTIVGDINVEYILTQNRRWRVRAFNRTNTATTSTLYNNAPYTQGVGIKYQRDFSNFGELFWGKK